MRRIYGVFVNGLLMNRFVTHFGADKLIASFAKQGIKAEMKILGDVLDPALGGL